MKDTLIKHLKLIIDKIESGESLVREISTTEHYEPVLNGETGEFIHRYTGDSMTVIRFKNSSDSISTKDLDRVLNDNKFPSYNIIYEVWYKQECKLQSIQRSIAEFKRALNNL